MTLEFRLLGTLEVEGAAGPVGSGKERALLAYLLLHRNDAVPRERLIDALWGDDPPATAAHAVDVYVSRLRKGLGADGLLESRRGSYRLNVADEHVDVAAFERRLADARAAVDPADRLAAAEAALALWRGHPLADLLAEPFARLESERLEEERAVAQEERFEALLALGRHDEAVGPLQLFVREHPLRERPRRQLMLALYRAGRQSQALDVYRDARETLNAELGLEPSRELRELEAAILRQDDALAAPARAVPRAGAAVARARSRRLLLAGGAAVVVAGGAAAALVLLLSGGPAALPRVDFNGVAAIDPGSGRIVSEVIPSVSPGKLATAGGSVWTTNQANDTVSGIDSSAQTVVHTIPVGSSPGGLAVGSGAVWVANALDGTVSRIDPGTEKVVQTIPVGNTPTAVASGGGSVWVANAGDRTVTRLDPRSGRVVATIPTGADGRGLAYGGGALWVIDQSTDTLVEIDPRAGSRVRAIAVGSGPAAVVAAFGSLWVANSFDGTISRIDPRRGVVTATVDLGGELVGLAPAGRTLWVANESERSLDAIDPRGNVVTRRIDVGSPPVAIAGTRSRLWLSVQADPRTHRGGTLRVVAPAGSLDTLDPALTNAIGGYALAGLTHDGLVAFRRASGSDGAQIVPDLAVAIPAPEDGGTTYTFQVRRGVRYSDGETVAPSDFRFALERVFRLRSQGSSFYAGLVGAAACTAAPRRCDLSRGVVADDRAGTVTFHLTAPDPEFVEKLALPFAVALPARTTPLRPATRPLPTTGPYTYTASASNTRGGMLVRNRDFHVWSAAAKPDGYPDRIVWDASTSLAAATTAIERNRADVFGAYGPPPDKLEEVETRYASRVHSHPLPGVEYVFLNNRVPPFDDVRVRRALNYALDRDEIVRLHGGPHVAQPTCQVLPPLIVGYRRYCPYTRAPSASGAWTAPDLAKARELVAASGTRGMRVTVWSYKLEPYARELRYVVAVLRELGYRAALRIPGDDVFYAKMYDSRTRAQAGAFTWIADYPGAADFLDRVRCDAFVPGSSGSTNIAEYCDPTTDRLIARAQRFATSDPEAAAEAWASVDRRVVDRAAYAPLYVPRAVDLVSSRVGNYEFSPEWGVLVDQLWVR